MLKTWLAKFKLEKVFSSAAMVLGATSFVAALPAPAQATAVGGNCASIANGGSDVSSPTVIPGSCNTLDIETDQASFPGFWEFTYTGATGPIDISATVVLGGTAFPVGTFYGSFDGSLDLYDATGGLLDSANFVGDFGDANNFATLHDTLSQNTQYILGLIDNEPTADPPISITVAPSATGVPEPATFSLLGGALAGFGFLRKRRKKSA